MINAKPLIKDKFWIIEENGTKLGTLQKKDNNGWIFLSKKDRKEIFHTSESLRERFGIDILETKVEPEVTEEPNIEDYQVHGFPTSQQPFNPMFDVQKQLPIYSKTQTPLVSTKYNKFLGVDKNAFDIYNNQLSPITTNGLISTSSVLALVSGFGTANSNLTRENPNFDMPMYNLGIINASASTSQFSEAIYAVNSPQYQTYPYLVLYSNLIANCELQVVGGANGKQLIPALAFLSTSYSENNFIYVSRSDLIFKVTKQHTITSVKTSIHLPDGSQAKNILGDDSAVVYRIDFVGRDLDGFLDENDDNK